MDNEILSEIRNKLAVPKIALSSHKALENFLTAIHACGTKSQSPRFPRVKNPPYQGARIMNEKRKVAGARQSVFESIRKVNDHGRDFWSARELGKILGYLEYRNFLPVIAKAKEACQNSGQRTDDHFVDIHEMVAIGSGAMREMPSI